jgi:hypothetical protein
LFAAYVETKQRQNVLDYDDLLLYWAQTLSDPGPSQDIGGRRLASSDARLDRPGSLPVDIRHRRNSRSAQIWVWTNLAGKLARQQPLMDSRQFLGSSPSTVDAAGSPFRPAIRSA